MEATQPPTNPPLRIVTEGWGDCDRNDVRKVLASASLEMMRYFSGVELPGIQVSPRGGPVVQHRRLADGFIDMRLDTGDRQWSQCTFQYGHELCHVLCRYDTDPNGNQWFEESLCELASLFVLRRMSATWQMSPPYPNWKPYATALREYADERIVRATLPDGETLAAWYRRYAEHLKNHSTDRDKNLVAATALLPLFEAEPEHWTAVYWINAAIVREPEPFPQYLRTWRENAPEAHRTFIEKLAEKFEISLPGR